MLVAKAKNLPTRQSPVTTAALNKFLALFLANVKCVTGLRKKIHIWTGLKCMLPIEDRF